MAVALDCPLTAQCWVILSHLTVKTGQGVQLTGTILLCSCLTAQKHHTEQAVQWQAKKSDTLANEGSRGYSYQSQAPGKA